MPLHSVSSILKRLLPWRRRAARQQASESDSEASEPEPDPQESEPDSDATQLATFSLFSQLPLELREYIWTLALSAELNAGGLFFYNINCWDACYLQPGDEEYNEHIPISLRFKADGPGRSLINIPCIDTNNESRRVAARWCDHHRVDIRLESVDGKLFASIPFEHQRDILYCSLDLEYDYSARPWESLFRNPWAYENYRINAHVGHLAIPRWIVAWKSAGVSEYLKHYGLKFTTFSLVVDPQPQKNATQLRAWCIQTVPGSGFTWDGKAHKFVPQVLGQRVKNKELRRLLKKICKDLEQVLDEYTEKFVVQAITLEEF